ncbi:MAG: MBL fold metallo-hydrolase [Parasphingopyxis sp.]|uniref:MBL fold metallo-hydrolase n=1 Tax=Parasphingopyxis sp. TaxID=1920299 RepID=UPI003FA0483D
MKLRIFKSSHGDCLLLQADGHNVLCDGGLYESMKRHVRRPLTSLVADNGGKLDAIYVSHIDQDHISGVLQLLRDALEWRVHDFHEGNGDTRIREPRFPRPPDIDVLWHNSFRDQVGENADAIGDLLAAAVPALYATGVEEFIHEAHEVANIASSIREALEVSRYAKPDLLDIPVNVLPGHDGPAKLLFRRAKPVMFSIGSLDFTLVGPSQKALKDLRDGWNKWLKSSAGRNGVKAVRKKVKDQLDRFAAGDHDGSPFDLRDWNGIATFKGVTAPNVASLVFMVEEDGKRCLLTGDTQQDVLLAGLKETGFLDQGHLHLDVLKVAHHGSEHNTDKDFAQVVSADHYVFCGDGSHGNPEPEVIQILYDSRLGPQSKRALAPEADGRPFTFWFSTNSDDLAPGGKNHQNFSETEELVRKLVDRSDGQMKAEFVKRDYRTLTV